VIITKSFPKKENAHMMDSSSVPSTPPTIDQLENESNLLMGLIGGAVAMLVSAIVWGAVTYFTNYQIGYLAVGVGFLVGIAVKYFGRGKTAIFGISSAILALMGTMLGNLMFYSGIIAKQESVPFLTVFFYFLTTPADLIGVFAAAFGFMDIVFYVLAAYVGFTTALDIRRKAKPAPVTR
jgi:hypothetical protein